VQRSPWRIFGAICLLAVGAAILVMIAQQNDAGRRDFIAYWSAGQQVRHGQDPYDRGAILRMERAAGFNQDRPLIMRNPPVALFLAVPLGYVSATLGNILWMIGLLACLMVSIRMIWALNGKPESRTHLLGYCFAPVMSCLMAGQLGILLLLGVVLFLTYVKTRPFVAGVALLVCAVKPHLYLLFLLVVLAWALGTRAWRLLAGLGAALAASCAFATVVDVHAWQQYRTMVRTAGIMNEFVPSLSDLLRWLVNREALGLQFLPACVGCVWALWYFRRHRGNWDWMDQGLLVLIVSVLCAPYSLFTDEVVLLPAMLTAVYRAENSRRSLIPFGVVAGIALFEVMGNIAISTVFYLWTVPAWLAWYLYATRGKRVSTQESDPRPATQAS
jgi:hypothetical protein